MKSIFLFNVLLALTHAQLDMSGDKKMEFEDNIAEESQSNDQKILQDVIGPKPILNDGKPFYVARDPTTGTLDFSSKKTVGVSNDIPISRKDEFVGGLTKGHDINSIGHTFHDYLNIPVKYSSSKFVYPLISSSYANLKYQGNNKNQVSNHKNYTSTLGTTMSPKYFTHIITSKSAMDVTTKIPEITRRIFTTSTTTTTVAPKTVVITTTTQRTEPSTTPKKELKTTKKPESTSTKAPETSTTTKATTILSTTESSEAPSTVKYSSTIIQSNQFPSTFKKYVDTSDTRKKLFTTTRAPAESTSVTMPANPVKFLDDLLETIDRKEPTRATTYRPQIDRLSFATSMPLRPSAFKPMPTETPKETSHKVVFDKGVDPAAMTLSEIFNSIAESANLSNERNEIAYEPADSIQIEVKKPLPLSSISTLQTTSVPLTTSQQVQKTLQQQMKEPQNAKPNVNIQPTIFNNPQNSPANGQSLVGFPNEQFDDYVEFENPTDQYVRYEVQKPNVNLVKFGHSQMPIPNMNNVVISPGQNSASFVLGSQQNVGSIGVGSSMGVGTSNFVDNNGPVKMGQVINDDPPIRPPGVNQIQASIRFPSEQENSFENAQIIRGTFKNEGNIDTVHSPQALAQNQPAPLNPVQNSFVFPTSNNNQQSNLQIESGLAMSESSNQPSNPSQIIFENVNDIYEKVNEKKQKTPPKEITNNDISPPIGLIPPNPHQKIQFNRQPQYGHQRRPQNPNILPQFRPNSRVSQGHPSFKPEIGSIRVPNQHIRPYMPQQALPKVGLPPMNPNLRRPQIPPQFMNRPPRPQMVESANRRVFKVPSPQQYPPSDRFMKPPPMQQPPLYYLNRPITAAAPETMQMQQRPSMIPYQDVELHKSAPPTIQTVNSSARVDTEEGSGKLEPVVTLQMLQLKKSGATKLNLASVPNDISQDISQQPAPSTQQLTSIPKNHKEDPTDLKKDPSVYVVYPVSSSSAQSNQPQPQHAPQQQEETSEEFPIKHDYQNTPFAVVSHFEQEPLLMKKDKKKPSFPYQIEKPGPPHIDQIPLKYNAQHVHSVYNIGEEPHNPISSKLTRVTEKPIAIAYTPTEPSRISPPMSYYQHIQPHNLYNSNKYSLPNYASPVISEIIDDYDYYHHRAPSHLNGGEELNDYHRPHYDFEAPFHASVSLNPEVTNPYQGWSIVTKATEENNKIDRSDHNLIDSSEELTTKKFDPNEFQPIFESGFQPIYSSNRVSTAPELKSNDDMDDFPSTMALSQISSIMPQSTTETPILSSEKKIKTEESADSSTKVSMTYTSTTTLSPPTTMKSNETKKVPEPVEIDSLEALFDSLTRDYDDEEEESSSTNNKSENESRSL